MTFATVTKVLKRLINPLVKTGRGLSPFHSTTTIWLRRS